MARITTLNVNGKKMTVDIDSTVSLLSVLRNDLDLTGSKYVAAKVSAGPARCCSKANRYVRALRRLVALPANKSSPSKAWKKMASCTRYRKLSSKLTRCNAHIALRG